MFVDDVSLSVVLTIRGYFKYLEMDFFCFLFWYEGQLPLLQLTVHTDTFKPFSTDKPY